MRGAAGEHLRIDIPFLGPDAREGVQAVGHGLAEDHHVRGDAEVLEAPELAGTVEAHLDFVVHEHDLALVEDLLEARVIAVRRDHIAARALDAFHIERGVFGFPGLGVPHAVIFGFEQALELVGAEHAAVVAALAVGAAEAVREGHEQRAFPEVPVTAAVAVGGGDGRRAERAPVVAALEGDHEALAAAGVAHELEGVLNGLRAAHVEVHAALFAPRVLDGFAEHGGEFDLFLVQVLGGDLRQRVDLALQGIVQARVGIAEVDGGIPHLEVEIGLVLVIVQEPLQPANSFAGSR